MLRSRTRTQELKNLAAFYFAASTSPFVRVLTSKSVDTRLGPGLVTRLSFTPPVSNRLEACALWNAQ